jgi:hypothetical protein
MRKLNSMIKNVPVYVLTVLLLLASSALLAQPSVTFTKSSTGDEAGREAFIAKGNNAFTGSFNTAGAQLPANDGYPQQLQADAPSGTSPLVFFGDNPDKTICPGGMVFLAPGLQVFGGLPPYTYNWSPASLVSNSIILNPSTSPAATTVYHLTVTDAAGSMLRDTVVVNVSNASLVKPVIQLVPGVPGSGYDTMLCVTAEQGVSYKWGNTHGIEFNNDAPRFAVLKNAPASYLVTISNTTGGCITSAPYYYQMIKANAGSDTSICIGQTVTLGGTPPYYGDASGTVSYHWSCHECEPLPVLSPSNPALTVRPGYTTTYRLFVTSASGIFTQADEVTVRVIADGARPTVTASSPVFICPGDSVTLTSSPAQSYIWSNGATAQSITVGEGTYTVSVNNGGVCNSAPSAPVTVMALTIPSPPVIENADTVRFCEGGSFTLSASYNSSGGGYLWNNGATVQSISITAPGNYFVRAVGANGCKSSPSNIVHAAVIPRPAAPVLTADGPTTFCSGQGVTLRTTDAGPGTNLYYWTGGGHSTFVPFQTFYAPGNYSVRVAANLGCISQPSNIITLAMNPLPPMPVITAGGPVTFCQGSSVQLSSAPASNYLWSNGATTQSISASSASAYRVTVIDSNGCRNTSQPVTVTVNPLPHVPSVTAAGPTTFCGGGSVQLTSSTGNNYLWSTGATTQSINAAQSGIYTVAHTNSFGCTATSPGITVMVKPKPPVPVIVQTGNTLSSSAAASNQWYYNGAAIPGATEQTYNFKAGGTYAVTVTDANGCTSSSGNFTAVLMAATATLRSGQQLYYQVSPNPVTQNAAATLQYQLGKAAAVSVWMVNSRSERINIVVNNQQQFAGTYRYTINAGGMQPGTYYVVFLIDGERITQRIVVL